MDIQVKIVNHRAIAPTRGSLMAAGYDLYACLYEPVAVKRTEAATLIPTGIAMFMNSAEVAAFILPRSGLGHKQGLVLGNTVGLIDGDYQNEWFISVWNRGQQEEIIINPGDRIAQVVFQPVIHPNFINVNEFEIITDRGLGGFGSTGVI